MYSLNIKKTFTTEHKNTNDLIKIGQKMCCDTSTQTINKWLIKIVKMMLKHINYQENVNYIHKNILVYIYKND